MKILSRAKNVPKTRIANSENNYLLSGSYCIAIFCRKGNKQRVASYNKHVINTDNYPPADLPCLDGFDFQ